MGNLAEVELPPLKHHPCAWRTPVFQEGKGQPVQIQDQQSQWVHLVFHPTHICPPLTDTVEEEIEFLLLPLNKQSKADPAE